MGESGRPKCWCCSFFRRLRRISNGDVRSDISGSRDGDGERRLLERWGGASIAVNGSASSKKQGVYGSTSSTVVAS